MVKVINPKSIQNVLIIMTSNQSFPLSKGGKRGLPTLWTIQSNFPYLDSQVTGTSLYWVASWSIQCNLPYLDTQVTGTSCTGQLLGLYSVTFLISTLKLLALHVLGGFLVYTV